MPQSLIQEAAASPLQASTTSHTGPLPPTNTLYQTQPSTAASTPNDPQADSQHSGGWGWPGNLLGEFAATTTNAMTALGLTESSEDRDGQAQQGSADQEHSFFGLATIAPPEEKIEGAELAGMRQQADSAGAGDVPEIMGGEGWQAGSKEAEAKVSSLSFFCCRSASLGLGQCWVSHDSMWECTWVPTECDQAAHAILRQQFASCTSVTHAQWGCAHQCMCSVNVQGKV